jgi:maltooligosyltrehalose trehalohydrolase
MLLPRHGALPLGNGAVRFSVWAPKPRTIELRLHRAGRTESHRLEPRERGVWELILADVPAAADYAYRLDGERDRADPVSRLRPEGVHGPTRVVDPAGFAWSDREWRGLGMADLVIYELHVGTFSPAGTFDGVIARLPAIRDLGATAIELMPVAQFPGARNWGYDGVSPYAVQNTYGGPDGLRRLVDAAHAEGLAVLLDVVYNHLGPEGNYLREFGPYFSDRYQTLWGEGFNLDGRGSDEVRDYVAGNAAYWISEYHLDGLRLDAADRIVDLSPRHIVEELTAGVHAAGEAAGRRTLVIAEIDSNDPRYIRDPSAGGYGCDGHWADDFHHAVHVALTGERGGYYRDFGGTGPVAKVLAERYLHDGGYSPYRDRRHGRPGAGLPAERLVVAIQNHDQVGNRARGERLGELVEPAALRLAAAILLLSPYVPLLFMGEEHADTSRFPYFVSHSDPALIEAVREGRRHEFAAFEWAGEVPDPQAEATFEASRPRWDLAREAPHAKHLALYRDLLRLRRDEPALRAGAGETAVEHDAAEGWIRLSRTLGERLLAIFNFARGPRRVPAGGERDAPRLLLSTEDPKYGGDGGTRLEGRTVHLAPHSAALLRLGPP